MVGWVWGRGEEEEEEGWVWGRCGENSMDTIMIKGTKLRKEIENENQEVKAGPSSFLLLLLLV